MTTSFKPLPSIPDRIKHIHGLCVESDALISMLLCQAIAEEGLEYQWLEAIKMALCHFGYYIESRKTLYHGIRSLRQLEKSRVAKFERSCLGSDTRLTCRQSEQNKANKEKVVHTDVRAIEPDSMAENRSKSTLSVQSKLKQIRHRILTQSAAESLLPMHLLVTVARPVAPDTENKSGPLVMTQSEPYVMLFEKDVFQFACTHENCEEEFYDAHIVYGLENWQSDLSLYVVGGTFTFPNDLSERQFGSLLSILRLSLYVYLSLFLEQSLLDDCHVALQYSLPTSIVPRIPSADIPLQQTSPPNELPQPVLDHKLTVSNPGGSIWSFISRKTESIIHRVSGSSHARTHQEKDRIDKFLPGTDAQPFKEFLNHDSFQHETNPYGSTISVTLENLEREGEVFSTSIRRLRDSGCILSTSLQVRFPPPTLLRQLALREEEQKSFQVFSSIGSSLSSSISSVTAMTNGSIRVTGFEKVGLTSIIGWDGRESRGKGICGIKGFIRQQHLTVLYRKYLSAGTLRRFCGKPSYITYQYYSQNSDESVDPDFSLGELIESLCKNDLSTRQCLLEDCGGLLQDHIHTWTFDDVTIEGLLSRKQVHSIDTKKNITAWQSCYICMRETSPKIMDAKSYLFSFAKYLEVLAWSPVIRSLSLCSHVKPTLWRDFDETDTKRAAYNVVYHFSYGDYTLSLRLSVSDVYELSFPRLQFVSGNGSKEDKTSVHNCEKKEKDELEAQIEQWWQGICIRMDRLDKFFEMLMETNKDLPPLPGSDDEGDEEEVEAAKKGLSLSLSPDTASPLYSYSSSPIPLKNTFSVSPSYNLWTNLKSFGRSAPYPPSLSFRAIDSRAFLAELKVSFRKSKKLLKSQLHGTSSSSLNDVRRNFKCIGQGSLDRLYAWQKKHVPDLSNNLLDGDNVIKDPEWWNNNCHAVPGGRVLVRESESGSIIAFTLSSLEYQRELAAFNSPSGYSSSKQFHEPHHLSTSSPSRESSKLSTASIHPDFDDILSSSQPEPCIIKVARCKHSREESLLGLRDASRNATLSELSSFNSRLGGSTRVAGTSALVPTSAWAQPQVQVSLDAADGELTQLSLPRVAREKAANSTYIPPASLQEPQEHNGNIRSRSPILQTENVHLAVSAPIPYASQLHPDESAATESNSLTETLTKAARYLFTTGQRPPRAPSPAPSSTLHALLACGPLHTMDEQPHIRYECVVGAKLQFSCIVYYAKQFDTIRRRCGAELDIINSLQRSEIWVTAGGKSKSNFWKTLDGKFVIKTLINAWNVADLQVLIDLAPSYFRYIDSTITKASALTKLMGFYTVEVKNLGTGVVQAKHDVLVMENLFYGREISQIYDLKGIPGRKVKNKGDQAGHKIFHDSEWIEVQKKNPFLLRGHSAHVLREGLRADAEFLAKSNIMDYSLLLGIDKENCKITCGLVDTIGSYTFAKTLEYKAKQNLSTKGKDATVIPPAEYQHRFTTALESYFLVCPDRWTKPQHYVDRTTPHELPEVL